MNSTDIGIALTIPKQGNDMAIRRATALLGANHRTFVQARLIIDIER